MPIIKDTSKSLEDLTDVYLCTIAKGRVALGFKRSAYAHWQLKSKITWIKWLRQQQDISNVKNDKIEKRKNDIDRFLQHDFKLRKLRLNYKEIVKKEKLYPQFVPLGHYAQWIRRHKKFKELTCQ